ncbi:hypothetical protein IGB42_01899 [Andreprevotia sp. IGB-42]|uniref:phospholipase D-like domain-containing protein n=1 Tax=Andreprevotia sp. IGB-42 TaxID=2497473 RepID=UPI00135CEAE1|nr:phospholipase D-like domain-containing protein [Andreprevotia sp. IGB-42]KAF0813548.1 hypothetical protein IGB42_01899 [Andreprevotia sp. IGB-42]
MSGDFQVTASNAMALFTLKLHRGEGMALLAMNWKDGQPPADFVGFGIEYQEPGGDRFFAIKNRLGFTGIVAMAADGQADPQQLSTLRAPIQKFRWVHFPRNADLPGEFVYRVTPVFMNGADELSYGEAQLAAIALRRETWPGQLNVTFTRGFVSSQAFVNQYAPYPEDMKTLLPAKADEGLDFQPTHPKAAEALAWMGFEARNAILEVLDQAIADPAAQVRVVAYDLSERTVVEKLQQLGSRLKIIIDNSGTHGPEHAAESQAAALLRASAGAAQVKRQHMGCLQHNKTILVNGPTVQAVVCGSTNFSWRGFYVQANNAVVLRGSQALQPFAAAFDAYWAHDAAADFGATTSASWVALGLDGIDAEVTFSPHGNDNAVLGKVADDIDQAGSSLFYSMAFLYQTQGPIRRAIEAVTARDHVLVYGMSDREVDGLDLQKPDGNVRPVSPTALGAHAPLPFKPEPTGGSGIRMHHKFAVIDFDQPTARVYLGSYNFSGPADRSNGENLLLIRDRRVAVAYMIEALRLFDHYHFRLAQTEASTAQKAFNLKKPPRTPDEQTWWAAHYTDAVKIRDRLLFA